MGETMFNDVTYADLMKWTKRLFASAFAVLAFVFGAYIIRFSPLLPISKDVQAWGQFGDYIGGTTNPILAFLSFTALLLTIILQGKQLENSSRQLQQSGVELELSRQELARSARAQERAERELARQADAALNSAKLTSINLLLDNYRRELADMKMGSYVASDPALQRLAHLEQRERALVETLEALYTTLVTSPTTP